MERNIPINKGNYSMETQERTLLFEQYKAEDWQAGYKEYRDNWVKYPKNLYLSEFPLLVDIELSSICNLQCPMCYTITEEFKNKVNTGLMEWELFKKIIDQIAGNVPAIRLSLRGEATIHPHFIDAIVYAKSKGIKEVSSLTNASILNDEFVKDIVKAGLDWLTVSIDGTGEVYNEIRFPLKFEETLKNIKNFHRIKKELATNKPVIKIQSIWPAIKNNPEEYYNIFSPYVDFIAFNPLIDYLDNDKDIAYENNFSCPQLYQRLVIGSDGLVMMCSNDEENSNIIGNANNQSIKEIWHSDKLNKVRSLHKAENGFLQLDVCKKCYLPRKTEDNETAAVNGRTFSIKNYVNRSQKIGQ